MVQIADGLYLGQLLFASCRLLGRFDGRRPPADYVYHTWATSCCGTRTGTAKPAGYSPSWRCGDSTGIGERSRGPAGIALPRSETGHSAACPLRRPRVCRTEGGLARHETVLHLLRDYSDKLQDGLDNSSPLFLRLQELFNRAAPVSAMRGFYRGALVSWHGAGLLDLFAKNALDLAWKSFAGRFSTWTGKSFDPISPERLRELTDGFETGELPSTWGANTQALRTMKEREVGRLMKLANIWTEPASQTESVNYGFDVKNFSSSPTPGFR